MAFFVVIVKGVVCTYFRLKIWLQTNLVRSLLNILGEILFRCGRIRGSLIRNHTQLAISKAMKRRAWEGRFDLTPLLTAVRVDPFGSSWTNRASITLP